MDKENVDVYTMEFCSAIKKNQIMSLAGKWIELKIILSKIRWTQKTNTMFSLPQNDI
jgi:hypothetical protein